MNRIKTKLLFWLILSTAIFSSCISEDDVYGGSHSSSTDENEIEVQVLFQMPASAPKTRAISAADENLVEQVDVLAFESDGTKPSGWSFAYSAQGHTIEDIADGDPAKPKKRFTVKLIKSSSPQTFVILANARAELAQLGAIGIGADKDALLARLTTSGSGSWNANNDKTDDDPSKDFDSFPMWGEVQETLTDAVTKITDVQLLRAIARFDVVLDAAVIAAGNFTLDEIYIYNSKNKGRLVPDPSNLETVAKVKAATEPTGNINNDVPLVYDVPASMNTAFERTIYLFEAKGKDENESSKATCVVVGGTYDTDGRTTYYRLDFLKKETTDSFFRDILRNHKYVMNILSVSGSGYDTADKAFNSKSFNMEAEVVEWDDSGMNNSIFDDRYQLTVNKDSLYFYSEGRAQEVRAYTDYPTGWTIEDGDFPSWLTITPRSGAAGDRVDIEVKADSHIPPMADREDYFYITAGRFKQKIKVYQTVAPELMIDVDKNSIVFRKSGSSAKSIAVTTYPDDANIYFTEIPGTNKITWATPGGFPDNGLHLATYSFQPAANSSGLTLNTAVVVYIMGADGSMASKTVNIIQLATDLLFNVTMQNPYPSAGGNVSFTVDSETDWTVHNVIDSNSMVSNWGNESHERGDNTSYPFTLTPNNTWAERSATFQVSSSDIDFAGQDIVITQNHVNPSLKLDKSKIDFGNAVTPAFQTVKVTSNSKWTFTTSGNWSNVVNTASPNAGTVNGSHTYHSTTDGSVQFTPKAWTAATGTPAAGTSYSGTATFTTTDHSPASAAAPQPVEIVRTVPMFFKLNTTSATAARAGQNVAVSVSTNAAWNATPSAGTALANQGQAAYGTRSANVYIAANTTWSTTTSAVNREVTVTAKYGMNTSSIGTAGGSFKVTQPGYYISSSSRTLAPSPSEATNAYITLAGAYPQMEVRVWNVTANAQLGSSTTIAGLESGSRNSNNITVAANASWSSRVLRMEYKHPINGWTTVAGGTATQAGYNPTLTASGTAAGGGFTVTVTGTGYGPELQLRCAVNNVQISGSVITTLAKGTTTSRTQTVKVPNNSSTTAARTVQIQYNRNGTWTNITTYSQPAGNIVLTSGRVVAKAAVAYTSQNWAEAMGIDPSNNVGYWSGNPATYVPTTNTGCGGYSEPGFPAKTWRLPTIEEALEMAMKVYSYTNDPGFTSATTDGAYAYKYAKRNDVVGTHIRTGFVHEIRCVRSQ